MGVPNAGAANGPPQAPHPAAVAPPRRATRFNPGPNAAPLVGGGNDCVANKALAATTLGAAPAGGGTPPPAHQGQLGAKGAKTLAL